jgi:ammonia channel protein AmtB
MLYASVPNEFAVIALQVIITGSFRACSIYSYLLFICLFTLFTLSVMPCSLASHWNFRLWVKDFAGGTVCIWVLVLGFLGVIVLGKRKTGTCLYLIFLCSIDRNALVWLDWFNAWSRHWGNGIAAMAAFAPPRQLCGMLLWFSWSNLMAEKFQRLSVLVL